LGENCTSNGWDQYVDVFRSVEFQHALWVTVKFALLTVPTGLVLGVGLAVLADKYLRGLAVFRLVFPDKLLRYAGGREVVLRDLQAMGLLAGANGLIVGNYLTTIGRDPAEDLQMLVDLEMPVKRSAGS
jgi:biotin synthase-like enzyme